ncbi:MAG: cyclic lactone autoinducer peptide [Lachnospiraceae bacterium]|nr:cyclic lactone autoinducer peptide [Lachnospiraceae bacterium]
MKKIFTKFLCGNGEKLCALAVMLASVAPYCCRGNWYQPKEPEGLEDFLKAGSCKSVGN